MSDGLKIQGEVSMSAGNTNEVLDGISNKAAKMAVNMAEAGAKAGKAIDEIGEAVKASDEKFTKAESNIVASAKRFAVEIAKGTKSASDALGQLDFNIAAKGLDPAKFAPVQEALRKLGAEYKTLAAAQNQFANASGATAEKLRSTFGSGLQNTSYQLQDFIVQVNGGVDATKALGQQLPQMLVGFGAAGAAIGVLAALLPNLVQAFSASADGAKTFKDAMSDFDKAVGDVGSTVKSFDMEKLYEEFNKSSAAVRAATVEQLNFQQEYIKTTQLIAGKKFGESIGDLGSFGTLDKLAGSFASSGSEKLAKQLGITVDVAKQLLPVLNGLKTGSEDVNNAFNQFGTALLGGNAKAVELAKTMNDLAKAERDGAAASTAISEAQAKMSKGHVQTKKELDNLNKLREKSAKSAEQEAEALKTLLDTINGKESGFDSNYVKNVETLLSAYDKGKISLEEYNAVFQRYVAMQPGAVAAAKELQKAEESRAKYMQTVSDETEKLVEKAKAAEYENSLIGKSADEIARLTTERYNNQIAILEEKKATIEKFDADSQEIEYIEKKIDALKRLRDADISKPKLQAQAREWENFSRDIERSLTDALYRSFESGESFGKSFAKSLENTFKTMVLKFAVQAITTTGGNLLNSGINAVAGTNGTNYFGLASNGSSIYNLANGSTLSTLGGAYGYGSAALGYTYNTNALSQQSLMLAQQDAAFGSSNLIDTGSLSTVYSAAPTALGYTYGTNAFSQQSMMLASQDAAFAGGSALGTAASGIGGGLAAYQLGKDYGVGAGIAGGAGTVAAGGAIYGAATGAGALAGGYAALAALGPWGWAAIAVAAVLGAMEQTGGPKLGGNYSGVYDGQGNLVNTTGRIYADEQTAGLTEPIKNQVDSLVKIYETTAEKLGGVGKSFEWALSFNNDVLGDAPSMQWAKLFDTAGQEIFSSFVEKGRGWEEIGAQLSDQGQRLIVAALQNTDLDPWANQIIDSIDAVKATAADITTAFAKLDAIKLVLPVFESVGVSSRELSASLIDLMGGLDTSVNKISAYYENFYSDTEKTARSWELMQRQFDALGVAMPKTREGFRQIVDGLDLNTAAGQQTFASLMNLQGAFAQLTPAIQSVADAASLVTASKSATDAAYAALQRAVDAQRTQVQVTIDVANEQISAINSLFSVLESNINDLRGATTQSYAAAMAELDGILANAKSSGYLPTSDDISKIVSSARAGMDQKAYASAFEQQRDRLVLAAKLEELGAVSSIQKSVAEQQLQAAQDQLTNLDNILKSAEDQINALRGIDNSVISVEEAIKRMQDAIVSELSAVVSAILASMVSGNATPQQTIAQLQSAGVNINQDSWNTVKTTSGNKSIWASSGGAAALDGEIYAKDGRTFAINDAVSYVNSQVSQNNAQQVYKDAIATGISAASLDAMMGWKEGTANEWAKINKLPAFAVGTNYVQKDMVAKIHEGEAIIPKPFNPWAGNVSSDNGTADEIKSLREEVIRLQTLIAESNGYARRTANAVNGNPEAPVLVEIAA